MTTYLKVGKLLVDAQMRQQDTALSTTVNHALAASISTHSSRRMWRLNGGVTIPDKDTARALNDLARHTAIVRILNDIRMDMEICEIEGWDKNEYLNLIRQLLNSIGGKDNG